MNVIFAKKSGMVGKYSMDGVRWGATVLKVLPITIKETRDLDKHGYKALVVRVDDGSKKTHIREIRTDEALDIGSNIKFEEVLKVGDVVKVTGTSKGKGFAGAVKRHGFRGGPRTHGQSDRERAPGSSGSTTTPGRVYKGKRRAGHMGAAKVTTKGLKVLEVNPESGLVLLSGSVPGHRESWVKIEKL